MSTFQEVANRAKMDPAFLGGLLVDPKSTLAEAGLGISEVTDARKLEAFLRSAQAHVSAAAGLVGITMERENWGIGLGCCNATVASALVVPMSDKIKKA